MLGEAQDRLNKVIIISIVTNVGFGAMESRLQYQPTYIDITQEMMHDISEISPHGRRLHCGFMHRRGH